MNLPSIRRDLLCSSSKIFPLRTSCWNLGGCWSDFYRWVSLRLRHREIKKKIWIVSGKKGVFWNLMRWENIWNDSKDLIKYGNKGERRVDDSKVQAMEDGKKERREEVRKRKIKEKWQIILEFMLGMLGCGGEWSMQWWCWCRYFCFSFFPLSFYCSLFYCRFQLGLWICSIWII